MIMMHIFKYASWSNVRKLPEKSVTRIMIFFLLGCLSNNSLRHINDIDNYNILQFLICNDVFVSHITRNVVTECLLFGRFWLQSANQCRFLPLPTETSTHLIPSKTDPGNIINHLPAMEQFVSGVWASGFYHIWVSDPDMIKPASPERLHKARCSRWVCKARGLNRCFFGRSGICCLAPLICKRDGARMCLQGSQAGNKLEKRIPHNITIDPWFSESVTSMNYLTTRLTTGEHNVSLLDTQPSRSDNAGKRFVFKSDVYGKWIEMELFIAEIIL